MTTCRKFIVITPVRDEVEYARRTVESMAVQTCRPQNWVIVDDGSTDGTAELLDECTKDYPWITVVHRKNRGFRAAGGGVMEAFYAGFDEVAEGDWEYVVKLDGDLSFAENYFELCFSHFESDPKLGIGGGTICSVEGASLRVDSVGDPTFHVRGATKIYRRECWNQIAPLVKAPGWDTLDEVKANYLGWNTRTFPELPLVQHKPTGSAEGAWRNAVKNGRANYLTGYHPLFMIGKCVRRFTKAPLQKEWLGLVTGYIGCYLRSQKMLADENTVRYLRNQQMRMIFSKPSIYSSPTHPVN